MIRKNKKTAFLLVTFAAVIPFLASSCDYFFPPFSGERISVEEAYKYITKHQGSEDLVIIDLRKTPYFNEGHIAGAINYSYDSTGFPSWVEGLERSKVYIVYSDDDRKSFNSIELMLELRFTSAHAITGGIQKWVQNGYPVSK